MDNSRTSPVRSDVLDVLAQLRQRIRRYVALEGSALVVVVLGVSFWLSLAIDYVLELSLGTRRFFLVVALFAIGLTLLRYLLLRVARVFRDRALALVLERRFPQLSDRLITAVEQAERDEALSPLTRSMLERTAAEAAELSRSLQLREVFNAGPLFRAAVGAAALFVSIGGFAWASNEVFHTWLRRNLLMSEDIYRRDTDMQVVVLAEPGERVVEFRDRVYKHPRGADLTFLVTVPDGKVVPEQVRYSYRNVAHSGGGGDSMTKIGQRQFRQRLSGLHESIRLWLSGGDYSTRTPYLVEVVDPPLIDRLTLSVLYPDYTGLNAREESAGAPIRQEVPVLGTQVSLPAGSDFLLEARGNKPLVGVQIRTDLWELRLTREKGALAIASAGGIAAPLVDLSASEPFLAPDGKSFRIPAILTTAAAPEIISEAGAVHLPLRLPPDVPLRITLHDDDDVMSIEPARLTINSIPDEPPRIETRLKGIGTSITRQATIPIAGEIQDTQDGSRRYGVTDDYGIADARFEYRVETAKVEGEESRFQPASFASRPEGQRQFPVDEKFAVLPLDLAVGVKLLLKVVAVDADNLTGPHVASSPPYSFQIVTDDELLSLIAVKELNLRRRFEQILEEVRNTRKDLLLSRTRLEEARDLKEKSSAGASDLGDVRDKLSAIDAAVSTSVERGTSGIRKNANETQSIEAEFREIRDELANNAIPDSRPMLDRIDDGIIRPLHSVNTVDYNEVDDALAALRLSIEERGEVLAAFGEPIERLNVTIEHLEAVLAQMLKLETVNEALQLLRDIIKSQEELQDRTRQERKKKLIEGLQ